MSTRPKHGSFRDVQYIGVTGEISPPRRGSHHDILADPRGTPKTQKQFTQVMGLMHDNVEALMIRDNKLESTNRRTSALEDNELALHHRARKPKR